MFDPVLNAKLDHIIELVEKQERRAKLAFVWRILWVLLLIVLPAYLSFIAFQSSSTQDIIKSIMQNATSFQNSLPQTPPTQ